MVYFKHIMFDFGEFQALFIFTKKIKHAKSQLKKTEYFSAEKILKISRKFFRIQKEFRRTFFSNISAARIFLGE